MAASIPMRAEKMTALCKACVSRSLSKVLFRSLNRDLERNYGSIDVFTRKCYSSLNQAAQQNSQSEEQIVIPYRIKRDPTDLLKALAKTVSKDYTAPHYKYHDDPFLIPASNIAKRVYSLAKESGRKSARWICDTYPTKFEKSIADPHIEAFMPRIQFDDKTEVTEATLKDCIDKGQVSSAIFVYNKLSSEGVQLNSQLKQSFLELLCFSNSEDSPPEEYIEERWFRRTFRPTKRKTWKDNGLAEQLFESMESKTAESYCAVIQGMAKYYQVERAYALYQEMQEKQLPADVKTYNSLIQIVPFLQEGAENRWQFCQQLLANLNQQGLNPNLSTFNSVMELLSKLGRWRPAKKFALETLGEMHKLNIEPSAATFHHLLSVFYKERGPPSSILFDVMDYLDGKQLTLRDPYDVFFFVNAMDICHSHLQDKGLALRIHNLLSFENNYLLIGDSMKEAIYFQHFFKLLCETETTDKLFEFYHQLIPNVYTPEPSVMLEIIKNIELYGSLKYIPEIWTDIVSFEQSSRESLLQEILVLLSRNKPEKELQEQFLEVAYSIKEQIDSQDFERNRIVIHWTGEMLGNILQVCLNAGKFAKACDILRKCDKEQDKIIGFLSSGVLENFLNAATEKNDVEKAIACLKYTANAGLTEANSFAAKIQEKFKLSEAEKNIVNSLILGYAEEKKNE